MASSSLANFTLQLLLLAICAWAVLGKNEKEAISAGENNLAKTTSETLAEKSPLHPALVVTRPKRYVGWGRRPGLRYSKASSVFDFDRLFNKLHNKYQKRGQSGPEAPISSFRELRMKQKVPNAQLLLPHLFNRNNRGSELDTETAPAELAEVDIDGSTRLNEDDVDALLFLLEDYARILRGNNE